MVEVAGKPAATDVSQESELILRTIISVNQLSIYGANSKFKKKYPKIRRLRRNLQRMKMWNQWKYLQDFVLLVLTPTRSCRETC